MLTLKIKFENTFNSRKFNIDDVEENLISKVSEKDIDWGSFVNHSGL